MQPYVFPYLGYFQLIQAVDRFIFYDDVNFIKRGWIHRNTILVNGRAHRFSIPLANASQHRLIRAVDLHPTEYPAWQAKFMKTLRQNYRKAPGFEVAYALVEHVLDRPPDSVASLAMDSIRAVVHYLELNREFVVASELTYDRDLRGADKILALCQQQGADEYINPAGGRELYRTADFEERGISLHFMAAESIDYEQFAPPFVPNLSVIDALMFCTPAQIRAMLSHYELT